MLVTNVLVNLSNGEEINDDQYRLPYLVGPSLLSHLAQIEESFPDVTSVVMTLVKVKEEAQ
jgi:hypothetical protein